MNSALKKVKIFNTDNIGFIKITNWINTKSFLSFSIRSNHAHYPVCLLNGKSPISDIYTYNGEYEFSIIPERHYHLVCRTQYDTKEYVIEESFYVSKQDRNYLWIIMLLIIATVIIWLCICLINELARFKGYIRINESSRLIGKNENENENDTSQNEMITAISFVNIGNLSTSSAARSSGEWRCSSCMYLNPNMAKRCEMCHSLKPVQDLKNTDMDKLN